MFLTLIENILLKIAMSASFISNENHSNVYNKSVEIFHLARQISHYITHDIAPLKRNGHDDPHIYITGDIVQQSVSLGPEILKAESQSFGDEKYKYATAVLHLANRLYRNCKRLQKTNSNGRDFLPIILKELRKFRKQLHTWRLTM